MCLYNTYFIYYIKQIKFPLSVSLFRDKPLSVVTIQEIPMMMQFHHRDFLYLFSRFSEKLHYRFVLQGCQYPLPFLETKFVQPFAQRGAKHYPPP